jgi:RNA polymerase sigma factor (sigma-70 family)
MARKGSLAEIEQIYRARGADFLRLAVARIGDVEAARDAVQEGFARAIRGFGSFRGEGTLEAWIARCVMNAARDVDRRSVADTSTVDPSHDESSSVGVSDAVRAAVARLPQRQRDALFLRFYLDFDYATIAETFGVEIGTVSATLHAARSTLAESLQEVMR